MTRGPSCPPDDHELEIRRLLGFITSSVGDATALGGATGPDERLRHEHVQDLVVDACNLAYVVARARIAHLSPDDVYLRTEALDDAIAGMEEVIRETRRGIERLSTRTVAPVGSRITPSRNGQIGDLTNRFSCCADAVA